MWAGINTGSRVELNAPAPGARKRGSGRKTILDPWVLELAKSQAKMWRGYFSVDDMWEFLQHKCEEERCVMDFSRSAVYEAMKKHGWAKRPVRVKPHLTKEQRKKRVVFAKSVLDELQLRGGWASANS